MSQYNRGYSPDKVLRLDYGFGADHDAIELGDGTLYLKQDLSKTTWFGMPYEKACRVLQNYVYFGKREEDDVVYSD